MPQRTLVMIVRSCRVNLAAFKVQIEAGQFHVGWFGDFDVAFGAVDDVDIVAETFDETGFVGGVHAVRGGFGESLFQKFGLKDLRSLRENDAFAGNGAGDERDVLRQATALNLFYGVHGGNTEDCGAAFAGFFDDAGNLLASDEWANGVVDSDQFHIVANVFEGGGNGFLPRGSAFDHSNRLAKLFLAEEFFHAADFIGASGEDDFADGVAGSEAAQGVEKDRHAIQFKELFGRLAAHACAHSSGGQDGSDSGHWNWGADAFRRVRGRCPKRLSLP